MSGRKNLSMQHHENSHAVKHHVRSITATNIRSMPAPEKIKGRNYVDAAIVAFVPLVFCMGYFMQGAMVGMGLFLITMGIFTHKNIAIFRKGLTNHQIDNVKAKDAISIYFAHKFGMTRAIETVTEDGKTVSIFAHDGMVHAGESDAEKDQTDSTMESWKQTMESVSHAYKLKEAKELAMKEKNVFLANLINDAESKYYTAKGQVDQYHGFIKYSTQKELSHSYSTVRLNKTLLLNRYNETSDIQKEVHAYIDSVKVSIRLMDAAVNEAMVTF